MGIQEDFMRHNLTIAVLIAASLAAPVAASPAGHALPPPREAPAAPLTADDLALVERAASYLEGLGQMRGHFLQTDPHGAVSQGELYLSRPGKARFEYQSPASLLVVADGHTVMVYDRRLKTTDRYPLGATPLGLFLQKHVRLNQKVSVTRVDRFAGGYSLTARDGKHETQGQVTLTFTQAPMSLTEWSILDAQGGRTTVRLSNLEPTAGLDPGLFTLRAAAAPVIR